jgi:polyisoprenoid-binding protein YceI
LIRVNTTDSPRPDNALLGWWARFETTRPVIKPALRCFVFVVALSRATGPGSAPLPCAPFEAGRVAPEIVATMRQAATEGRLYRVDNALSRVGFCVRHFPFQEFRGEFTDVVGGLAFPPDRTQYGQALLLIRTASLQSDNRSLAPVVRGSNFMDTVNYPEILYVGQKFEWFGSEHAHIYGDLTVRGRTHPVIFDVDIEVGEDALDNWPQRVRLRGLSHVSRFNFDMHSHRLFVSDTVRLCLSVELVRWSP